MGRTQFDNLPKHIDIAKYSLLYIGHGAEHANGEDNDPTKYYPVRSSINRRILRDIYMRQEEKRLRAEGLKGVRLYEYLAKRFRVSPGTARNTCRGYARSKKKWPVYTKLDGLILKVARELHCKRDY